MKHIFDVDIAKEYGVPEAILLENLYYWIQHNKANNTNFYEGKHWTYNSVKAFTELFPYYSKDQLNRTVERLKKQDLIITGCFNKSAYDRTLWYALTDKAILLFENAKSISRNSEIEIGNSRNQISEIAKPIPYINTDIKPNNNNSELPKNQNKKEFTPPTLEEIEAYIKENNFKVNAQEFYRFYSSCNWKDSNERLVKNWKNKMRRVWVKEDPKPTTKPVVSKAEQDIMDKSLSMSFEEEQAYYERRLAEQRENVK